MTLAWRLLASVLAAAGLVGSGYWWGGSAADNRHAADQLETERTAAGAKFREFERGDAAQADLGQALRDQDTRYSQLESAFNELQRRRAPLVVRVPVPGAQLGAAPTGRQALDPAQTPGLGDLVPSQPGQFELQLSAGAVWMWNSALAGADRPAGTCGLADTTEAACAAGTGITFDIAARNQATNAQLCAEDRVRHDKLIDFILQKKGTP